jgi:mannose-1-phosphate guanylyltransferase/mannose-6-phosphate isomerase
VINLLFERTASIVDANDRTSGLGAIVTSSSASSGSRLSLRKHHHRSEHRIVVRCAARVTVNETVKTAHENESIYIPIGAVHRLENPGKILLELIEVQTGSYLGEDDIIRIEDDYRRS